MIWFTSCRKESALDCFKSNGKEISEIRYPGFFSEIKVNDKIEVTVFKGTEYKVEVIAGKHILKNISTGITDNVLIIENRNKCNFVRGYKKQIKVNITVPRVEKVTNNGVAPLRFHENYSQDTLQVRAESSGDIYINGTYNEIRTSSHGNGDIHIHGTSNRLYAYTYGINYLYAEELLISDYAFIETVSIGDCYLNGRRLKQLNYRIWRDGNIYYNGNPLIVEGATGENTNGKLIQKD